MNNDSLGDRMKRYEAVTRSVLLPHSYTIIRVDGKAFHTYLANASKPFDGRFITDMMLVGRDLCRELDGACFAYGQSDEISVLLQDLEPQTQPWFGGVIQKIVSVAASTATMSLMTHRDIIGSPRFDARVFTLPSAAEVANYFIWRQRDAVRNSISMAAQSMFTHSQLLGKTSNMMQDMMMECHGVNWNDYQDAEKRGWVVIRNTEPAVTFFVDKVSGEMVEVPYERSFWQPQGAPHFVYGSVFFDAQIPEQGKDGL